VLKQFQKNNEAQMICSWMRAFACTFPGNTFPQLWTMQLRESLDNAITTRKPPPPYPMDFLDGKSKFSTKDIFWSVDASSHWLSRGGYLRTMT
jgi:hypothetical protein